ncbi:MAG: hypothetical protein GF364_15720 [Candidatus Lokiarchaeota archaeon]|nr:hypothetical protein [Candidatus Lokiarchaeota archaeon]
MLQDLIDGVKEIFQYKEMLKDVILAEMNTPDYILDKIFPIYEQMVDLVETFDLFTVDEIEEFMNVHLIKYIQRPFFPVFAGLYINALINKLFQSHDEIKLNIEEFCDKVLQDAETDSELAEDKVAADEVGYSLDYLGYLMGEGKKLIIKGSVGDFAGALMDENAVLIVYGKHGRNYGYERDPTSKIY